MDDELKRKLCQLVAGLVITDEDLDPREEAFVERMLTKFGLDSTEREVIFPLVDSAEAATTMRELPEAIQQEALSMLVEAAAADGKVAPEELEYLRAVANVLDVDMADIEQRLARALAR